MSSGNNPNNFLPFTASGSANGLAGPTPGALFGSLQAGFSVELNDGGVIAINAESIGNGQGVGVNAVADGTAVHGTSFGSGTGVSGTSISGTGVSGQSTSGDAVQGVSNAGNPKHAGVSGINNAGGFGVFGQGTPAGHFEGDVECTGTIHAQQDVVLGGDCAEDFDVASDTDIEPGTVMVLDGNGALRPSEQAYDKRVAGVISGAGDCQPGVILGRSETTASRMPLALVGKVYCKVDAQFEPVEVGDMLTTSPTPGHAMRASDATRAFGSVIGKALAACGSGQGLVPMLIALQ
jgi:hypothetical protein